SKRQKNIKRGEINAPAALVPRVPAEQCDSKTRGQRHISRGRVRKSNDPGATSRNERAVEFAARAKAPQKKVNRRNQHGGVKGARQTGRPVADAGDTKRHHSLPVIEHRLFQPRLAPKRGRNPIGAIKHFACDLCVARFVRADEAKSTEPVEEKESAKRRQQQQVSAILW